MAFIDNNFWDKLNNGIGFKPEFCNIVVQTFMTGGNMVDFCLAVGCSIQRATRWQIDFPEFKDAVDLGKALALKKWLKIGEENIDNKEFNTNVWLALGRRQFGSGEKVSLMLNGKSDSPLDHYNQIMHQASSGSFSSAELKQIMESINIGLRAYEVGELQKDIEELKAGLSKMEERQVEHQVSDRAVKEED